MKRWAFARNLNIVILGALTCIVAENVSGIESDATPAGCCSQVAPGKVNPEPLEGRKPHSGEDLRFQAASRRLRPAIVLLGHQGPGHGTGFVISRRHRLVATAAHVADHAFDDGKTMQAVIDGTSASYRVERVWYHPGIIRCQDDGLYFRSASPADGRVAIHVADVAVVQLSEGGPPLPVECELAGDKELAGIEGQPAGLLGFPGSPEQRWPTRNRTAKAEFTSFDVVKTTDLFEDEKVPPTRRQYLWYDSDLGSGTSGAPIFLANGHVIGVASLGKFSVNACDRAVRIDCVRELQAYHKMAGATPAEVNDARSRSDWGPDPRIEEFRKAARLVEEADHLRRIEWYREAVEKCDEAIRLVPNYPGALLQRSKVYLYSLGRHWDEIKPADRVGLGATANADSYRCLEIFPEWNTAWLIHAQNMVYRAVLDSDPACSRDALKMVDEMLSDDWRNEPLTENERSFAFNVRAQCHHILGEMAEAEKDYDESIRLAPVEPRWYLNRAQFREQQGRRDLAEADRLRAQTLRQKRRIPQVTP